MASPPLDTQIIDWKPDFTAQAISPTTSQVGSGDTGSPVDDDNSFFVPTELRNVKSVSRAESVNKPWERWKGLYGTLAYVDGLTVTFTEDMRDVGQLNRRVQAVTSAAFLFGTIVAATWDGSLTTMQFAWDAGFLDATVSEIMFGSLTPTNGAFPPSVAVASDFILGGAVTFAGSGTATAILPTPMANSSYYLALSKDTDENVWWSAKTPTQFTANSSNSASTLTLNYLYVRVIAGGVTIPTTLLLDERWEAFFEPVTLLTDERWDMTLSEPTTLLISERWES